MSDERERECRDIKLRMFHMANTSVAFTQDIEEGLNTKDKQMILTNLIFYAFRQLGRDP